MFVTDNYKKILTIDKLIRLYIFPFIVLITLIGAYKTDAAQLLTGADNMQAYLPKLQGKKVALLVNHTAVLGNTHLADTLKSSGIQLVKIFSPEHGFRGNADAGQTVKDSVDKKTGLPIISLYGNSKKPKPAQLAGVDIVVFDIQDVGARFYTYISSMHYMMEACAENNISMLILDRPNPNGDYIAGPVLDTKFSSFVGMHPIPVVHGLTVGELANMINGEGWLKNGIKCNIEVIKCSDYTHKTPYVLPVKPSPNLPNAQSINLYPSLCLFEGTDVSVGRGTTTPFQVIGAPYLNTLPYTFTPKSMEGASKNPPYENKLCYGLNLTEEKTKGFTLKYLIQFYNLAPDKTKYFNAFFTKLIGNDTTQKMIVEGKTEQEIMKSWEEGIKSYKEKRKKYLLYEDFE